MKRHLPLLILSIFVLCNGVIVGQQKNIAVINETGHIKQTAKELKEWRLPTCARNNERLYRLLNKLVLHQQEQGYLTFSVDSVKEDSTHILIHVQQGNCYTSHFIHINDSLRQILKIYNIPHRERDSLLTFSQYSRFSQRILSHMENHGFPFAETGLTNTILNDSTLAANFYFRPNQYITFDSIINKGNLRLSKHYLYPYLGLRHDKAYNESVFQQIPSRISELPFATEERPSGLEFMEDKAYLYLFLNKQQVNQFDGFMGIAPINEKSGKIGITGQLDLSLKNLMTLGETIELHWLAPEAKSQKLDINIQFPYLFKTPFGVNFVFQLDKTDTSYLNMNYTAGIQYSILGNSFIRAYFDYTTSNILAYEYISHSNGADFSWADYKKRLYGLSAHIRRLDYLYNPRKGFTLELDAAVGRRNIIRNGKIDPSLYEGAQMQELQYRITGRIRGYIPLHPRWILVLEGSGGSMYSQCRSFHNDLFKIGGLNSLRGVSENAITASTYAILLGELRFIFAKRSYLTAFYNHAWYERNLAEEYVSDMPFGFGLGIALDTKAGIFSLSYALGKEFNNPISFKTGKIHFGLAVNF